MPQFDCRSIQFHQLSEKYQFFAVCVAVKPYLWRCVVLCNFSIHQKITHNFKVVLCTDDVDLTNLPKNKDFKIISIFEDLCEKTAIGSQLKFDQVIKIHNPSRKYGINNLQ
ncbi:hypothetical protein MIMGU_mgv11b019044mg [Erythranthe guttata]|uniref:Uncharacterized protein n=1 Tax=Erythranthe guttata TaxID=4155 RepID=A0A022RXX4_ERYGU|nr:hypothetical protein MIMGU_mgv11b019044mg [Erythranthe guttata]